MVISAGCHDPPSLIAGSGHISPAKEHFRWLDDAAIRLEARQSPEGIGIAVPWAPVIRVSFDMGESSRVVNMEFGAPDAGP